MSNRNLVGVPPQSFGVRLHATPSPATRILGFVRSGLRGFSIWLRERRDRKRLYEYLASDHRAAADIGYPHRLP